MKPADRTTRNCLATAILLLVAGASFPLGARAQAAAADSPVPAPDYADGASWLCRPGRQDACAVDLTATVVRADGTMTREAWSADPAAPIDCFYAYPTVSTDPSTNSDMNPDAAELRVVAQQFARFASVCRPFAPSYRQVTLAGLRARMAGGVTSRLEQGIGYEDVRAAFRHYLEHDNGGRGFVLIGHSQGTFILTELIRQEIDGRPLQGQLVSALLIGAGVTVARGQDVGGSFRSVPLCRSVRQTGCVVAYSAFRSTAPPPANTLFGRAPGPDLAVACTNPAALAGGSSALHAYLASGGTIISGAAAREWVTTGARVETPYVSVPGLLSAECASNENGTYLSVTVHGDPSDPRADDIGGDLTPQWGLHLVDVNLALGDLLALVREQSTSWRMGR
jgi:hypothetical protein